MLFSTPKTKGGLRSDSLGDSSKITPSIWETRWPAAEAKKKKGGKKIFLMARGKIKGGRGEEKKKTTTKPKQTKNPGDIEAVFPRVLPAHPRAWSALHLPSAHGSGKGMQVGGPASLHAPLPDLPCCGVSSSRTEARGDTQPSRWKPWGRQGGEGSEQMLSPPSQTQPPGAPARLISGPHPVRSNPLSGNKKPHPNRVLFS